MGVSEPCPAADAAGLKAGKDYPGPWPSLLPFVDLLVVIRSVSWSGFVTNFRGAIPGTQDWPKHEVPVGGLFRSPTQRSCRFGVGACDNLHAGMSRISQDVQAVSALQT